MRLAAQDHAGHLAADLRESLGGHEHGGDHAGREAQYEAKNQPEAECLCDAPHLQLLNVQGHGRLRPELLQTVVRSGLLGEDVDDHRAEVRQQPAVPKLAFEAGVDAGFGGQLAIHRVTQRTHLGGAARAADDEMVGNDRQPPQVEQNDLGRPTRRQNVNCAACEA